MSFRRGKERADEPRWARCPAPGALGRLQAKGECRQGDGLGVPLRSERFLQLGARFARLRGPNGKAAQPAMHAKAAKFLDADGDERPPVDELEGRVSTVC